MYNQRQGIKILFYKNGLKPCYVVITLGFGCVLFSKNHWRFEEGDQYFQQEKKRTRNLAYYIVVPIADIFFGLKKKYFTRDICIVKKCWSYVDAGGSIVKT